MDYDRILSRLFVGSHAASVEDIDRLRHESGITAVLNLQTEEDISWWQLDWPALASHYWKSGIEFRRVPIRDADPVDLREKLREAVGALRELLDDGHSVFVHCTAGVGRSPAVVIAYLHWCHGWELGRAVAHVKQCRSCSPSVEAIWLASRDLPDDDMMRRPVENPLLPPCPPAEK